jgi:hypothetical protein
MGLAGLVASRQVRGRADSGGRKVKIKIAQIGTGHAHASGKMAAMRRSRDFEVVGVAEPDARRKANLNRQEVYRGVPVLSVEQLLNIQGLRAVAVETEVCDLLTCAERCIAAGVHVHLDKPAGESLPHFRKLLPQAVPMPKYVRYDDDLADLAKLIRGEKAFEYTPAHDLAVQESVLLASGRGVS